MGKPPMPPSYLGNRLSCAKFLQSLELAELGDEFYPRLPLSVESPFAPLAGEIVVLPDQLVAGLRWSLSTEVIDLCEDLGIAPTQLSSNSWRVWFALSI